MKRQLFAVFLAGSFFVALISVAYAEEFYCEVMALEGVVTLSNRSVSGQVLQEGDLLKVDDVVQVVGTGGYADLAYDRQWNSVTRVEENSKIRIQALYPTTVELQSGGVYAKLRSLPKDSSFDVQTPTAIASVRGTEYRTTFLEGQTQVYNLSDSDVYVYGLDNSGRRQTTPVIIHHSEKTQVIKRGAPPVAPLRMQAHELQRAEHFRQGIDKKINENLANGHFGKIPMDHRSKPKILSSGPGRQATERIASRGEHAGDSKQGKTFHGPGQQPRHDKVGERHFDKPHTSDKNKRLQDNVGRNTQGQTRKSTRPGPKPGTGQRK